MPTTNYASYALPSPTLDQMGPMTGIQMARQEEMLRRAQELGLEGMLTGNRQAAANLGRYNQLTPHEVAIKGHEADVARARSANPGYIPSQLRGEMGDHSVRDAQGRAAQATWEGSSRLQNSSNSLATLRNEIMRAKAVSVQSPMEAQRIYQSALGGAPAEIQQRVPSVFTPEVADQLIDVLADTPEHRQTKNIHRMDNSSREIIAEMGSRTNRDIAAMNNDRARDVAAMKIPPADKIRLENFLTGLAKKIASGQALSQAEQNGAQWAQQLLYGMRPQQADPVALNMMMMQMLGLLPQGAQPPARAPTAPIPAPNPGQTPNTAPLGSPSNPIILK